MSLRKWQKIPTISDRRRHGRAAVLLRAKIRAEGGDVRGFVRNLSETGAMMDAHHALATDMVVTLHCGDMAIPARVAWVEERRLGLQFNAALDAATVAMLVATPRAAVASA